MSLTSQPFPNLGAPLVSAGGVLTREWRTFFQTIWARTGSVLGGQAIQTGTLIPYAGRSVPEGFLLCDGAGVSRKTYPNLFLVIGTAWGSGDGTTTFNLPDARGRSLLGADSKHGFGAKGGSTDFILTTAQLPQHSHAVSDPGHHHTLSSGTVSITDPGHSHKNTASATPDAAAGAAVFSAGSTHGSTSTDTTGISGSGTLGGNTGTAQTGIAVLNTGQGEKVSVEGPWIGVQWLIKT
jgi:microcystin-dependent protein